MVFNDSSKCSCRVTVLTAQSHFKFPKVELAHILGEEGNFCIVLSSVSTHQDLHTNFY